MRLTDAEVKHFKNVLWGVRFWRYFRWVFLAILTYAIAGHYSGWNPVARPEWLAAGAVYLAVAWPGLCRVYAFHTLHRLVSQDPEARAQLAAEGVRGFHAGVASNREHPGESHV